MAEKKVSHNNFSIKEIIGFAWKVATKNFWFFARILLIAQVISFLTTKLSDAFLESDEMSVVILGILFTVAGWIIDTQFTFAQSAIYFKYVDKKKAELNELFSYFNARIIWNTFVIYALLGLGTIIGLLLFIFPGIYFVTKYWFALYVYVDKRGGIMESFHESARLTQGIKTKLFLLGLVQILILIGGALAFLVGLFVAIPMNALSDIYLYRKLSAKK